MIEDENNLKSMSELEIKESLSLHEYLKPNFEGHALWTEDFLLRSLGKEETLEKRLEELKSLGFYSQFHPELRTQRDVYDNIKNFEKENGIFELWYSLGFPRQFDKKTLIEIAREKLGSTFDSLVFLISFGSRNPKGDIDLCAVLEDDIPLEEYIHSRTIDLSQFNHSDFLRRADLFDLPITQPILTGDIILGDSREFEKLKLKITQNEPDERAIKYLGERRQWCLDYAIDCFRQSKENDCLLEVVLNNLSYALSFREVRERYVQGSKALIFSQLNDRLLKEIKNYLKQIETNPSLKNRKKVRDFLMLTKER